MNATRKTILDSVKKDFEAKKANALSKIVNYLENPSGVAEHSDISKEVSNAICKYNEADENLKGLEEIKKRLNELNEGDFKVLHS